MNSLHDLGGLYGFGSIAYAANELVFNEPWEGRVFGMSLSLAGKALCAVPELRDRAAGFADRPHGHDH
ncbi:MAG: nitrile hydratase subunit beta [Gammaproteobacteria bacterium]|nr:nitrile hydratase subunit beta [Gammaproteobacteria bacterium]